MFRRSLNTGALATLLFVLWGCSPGTTEPEISRQHAQPSSGMTYDQYRSHADEVARNAGGMEQVQRRQEAAAGNRALHKRFMALDLDNNGILSPNEFNGR